MKNLKPYSQLKKEMLSDAEVKKYYDKLGTEYELIRSIIDKRLKRKMSQADLAKKAGTRQSAISRLESGESNPSFKFLQKIATALESNLKITFQ